MRFALLSNQLDHAENPFRDRALSLGRACGSCRGVKSPVHLVGRWTRTGAERTSIHQARNERDLSRILRECQADRLLIDLDSRSTREETSYLRLVETFLQGLRPTPDTLPPALLIPREMENGPKAASRQRIVAHLERLGGLGVVFSPGSADSLTRSIQIASGSSLPLSPHNRESARASMGFDRGASPSFVAGVIGSQSDLLSSLLVAGLREISRLIPGCKVLYLGPDSSWVRGHYLPISILDAGMPGPEELSTCLKAMDLVLLPSRHGNLGENPVLAACLQYGIPTIASTAEAVIPAPWDQPLAGFWAVPESDLGQFLVSIEQFCAQRAQGAFEDGSQTLAEHYKMHLAWEVSLSAVLHAWNPAGSLV